MSVFQAVSVGGKEGLYGATTSPPPGGGGGIYHYAATNNSTHYQGVYSPAPMYSPTPAPHYSPAPMYSPSPAAGIYSPAAAGLAAYSHPEGCFYHLSKPDSLQNIAAGNST